MVIPVYPLNQHLCRSIRNGEFKEGERRDKAGMSWLIQDPHPLPPAETGLLEDSYCWG